MGCPTSTRRSPEREHGRNLESKERNVWRSGCGRGQIWDETVLHEKCFGMNLFWDGSKSLDVNEIVDMRTALGKKRVTARWMDHRKTESEHDLLRECSRVTKQRTMCCVCAGSTPSTGRVINDLSLKKSYHTFTADVTNAYFHVDEDE